ncbi:hypothetical protein EVAR_79477_1 [Eumeta japonica]|uniref:Uncharacterized protein n=1 Tax=Eumeta variegata TaxID=151549 RepID=A0A4C1UDW7_EUMVA|nr:hypothetical protein EVAR_79477_1 [Eumeta japonica]
MFLVQKQRYRQTHPIYGCLGRRTSYTQAQSFSTPALARRPVTIGSLVSSISKTTTLHGLCALDSITNENTVSRPQSVKYVTDARLNCAVVHIKRPFSMVGKTRWNVKYARAQWHERALMFRPTFFETDSRTRAGSFAICLRIYIDWTAGGAARARAGIAPFIRCDK